VAAKKFSHVVFLSSSITLRNQVNVFIAGILQEFVDGALCGNFYKFCAVLALTVHHKE